VAGAPRSGGGKNAKKKRLWVKGDITEKLHNEYLVGVAEPEGEGGKKGTREGVSTVVTIKQKPRAAPTKSQKTREDLRGDL